MKSFDWHSDPITKTTPVNEAYRSTQNVRRFMQRECGDGFRFDRGFMQWVREGTGKTMGDVVQEWLRRRAR